MSVQERAATGDHHCRFVPNVPYAFISSALTFWFPVIIMLTVYYLVFKEAVKQKQNMERMTAIRTLPHAKHSLESDTKTTAELLETSNSSEEAAGSVSGSGSTPSFHKPHTISPSELDSGALAVTPTRDRVTTSFLQQHSPGSQDTGEWGR